MDQAEGMRLPQSEAVPQCHLLPSGRPGSLSGLSSINPHECLKHRFAYPPYHRRSHASRSRGLLPRLLARSALHGVPEEEADLFSHYFDASFTEPMIDLGRADASRQQDEILRLLS
jgi:hypothetical protein